MQLDTARESAPSHPPATLADGGEARLACTRQLCRQRRWRVCGRPGCSGLQAYPQQHADDARAD